MIKHEGMGSIVDHLIVFCCILELCCLWCSLKMTMTCYKLASSSASYSMVLLLLHVRDTCEYSRSVGPPPPTPPSDYVIVPLGHGHQGYSAVWPLWGLHLLHAWLDNLSVAGDMIWMSQDMNRSRFVSWSSKSPISAEVLSYPCIFQDVSGCSLLSIQQWCRPQQRKVCRQSKKRLKSSGHPAASKSIMCCWIIRVVSTDCLKRTINSSRTFEMWPTFMPEFCCTVCPRKTTHSHYIVSFYRANIWHVLGEKTMNRLSGRLRGSESQKRVWFLPCGWPTSID